MQLQVVAVLRRPPFALLGLAIALVFSLVYLYFDEFYFLSPYLVAYVDPTRLPTFLLDLAISGTSGVVLTLSFYEVRQYPGLKRSYRKSGFAGLVAAFVAGACPCYYLVPLLAALGGAGGILGAVGILFSDYEFPIKLGSLALLAFAGYTLERSLRTACEIVPGREAPGLAGDSEPRGATNRVAWWHNPDSKS